MGLTAEHLPEESHDLRADLFLAAGDHVVFAIDFDQGGVGSVSFHVFFAAPHGDDGVLGAVEEQDGAFVGSGRPRSRIIVRRIVRFMLQIYIFIPDIQSWSHGDFPQKCVSSRKLC